MNRLDKESSLYLRQHAENPVHWQPWDEAALDSARDSGRPILLSIGYSACHWCHVMAHESFEDEATAAVMNRLFVNIKVDREERPDLDRTYQLAHQLLTGRGGGWPLTVFLDPVDLVPFFAGTYFPPERRYGMPAFREVLEAVSQWFLEHPEERQSQAGQLRSAMVSLQRSGPEGEAAAEDQDVQAILTHGADLVRSRYDRINGGFGGAPRFPQAPLLEAIAVLAAEPGGGDLGRALEFTLEKMARSGLRDHIEGGFFRYCVDDSWTIPHFEKMLYDNAMLLPLYATGAARWDNALLESTAAGIADWLETAMRQHSGGHAASIDADAGGEEGGFHVWSVQEVEASLSGLPLDLFRRAYGLDRPPNFEGKAWHLQLQTTTPELCQEFGLSAREVETALDDARRVLRERRESRVHPTLDRKQLGSWNALLAGGYARAARALGRDEWLDRADDILAFIRRELWQEGALFAVLNEGEARFHAYLDDYAWLLNALLDYLPARWSSRWLEFAIEVADALLERFEDSGGGFYFSDTVVEAPILRTMPFQDDATPSGNGIAVFALNRLGRLLGEQRYTSAAERCLARAMPRLRENPLAHATLLPAMLDAWRPPSKLVLGGTDPEAQGAMKRWVESRYRLDCYLVGPTVDRMPGMLREFRSDQPVTAWLCRGTQCLPPVHSQDDLDRMMIETED
jgi:uncharacterized protein YyaL (SSP411 family)